MLRESAPATYDVRSTRRPEPPRIHSVIPLRRTERTIANNSLASFHQTIGVRVYLRRPWFTTGEGELLGVSVAQSQEYGEMFAEGHHRDLLSCWGSDPYEPAGVPGPYLVPEMIKNRVHVQLSADLPDNPHGDGGHTIAGVEVQFDAERDLWFADVELDMDLAELKQRAFPMLRLSLVRFQPGTNEFHPECSATVRTDFVGLPPSRTLRATKAAPNALSLTVEAPGGADFLEARWQVRMLDAAAPDICVDATEVNPVQIAPISPTGVFCQAVIHTSATGAALTRLMTGRILVEERRDAWSIASPASTSRVTWTDFVDLAELTATQ